MVNDPIDWDDLLSGYNYMYGTKYMTHQQMVTGLYQQTDTLQNVGDILGVSREAVGVYMQKWGLPRKPKGHRGNSQYQIAYRTIEEPGQYTHKELSLMVGCSMGYIPALKKRWGNNKEGNI